MKLAELISHRDILEYIVLQGPVGVMAIHGGNIERGTEQMAHYVATHSNSSLYVISPRTKKRDWKFHISSNKINPEESEKLTQFLNHVSTAISIHGHVIKKNVVCIGGLNTVLRKRIVETLQEDFEVVDAVEEKGICRNLSAQNPKNIVNLAKEKGVQVEIPLLMRKVFDHRPYDEMPSEETKLFTERLIKTIKEVQPLF
ncbi:MAG: poly-gamma-glutamate hydrolase family protein [Theionarchaea archaeon]|nr:poly-gamma-glutamate hydrolase family protein [Theionarchaea archaeon]